MNFTDPKSRHQIAEYIKHKMLACDDWNSVNARRWNEHLRDAWEIFQLKPMETTGDEVGRADS